MCSRSIAAMFSSVSYFRSPVTCLGHSFQRKRTRHSRSSIGWLSITSDGITSAETAHDLCFAAIHDIVGVVAHIRSMLGQHDGGIWVGGTHTQISHALIAASRDTPILCSWLLYPIMTGFILLTQVLMHFL